MATKTNFSSEILQHDNILRSFALTLTRNKQEADDLVQDTLYRALANQEKFSEGTNVKAWLFTILRNIFINNYRRQRKSRIVTDTTANNYLLNSTPKTEKNESERSFLREEISKAMKQVSLEFTEPFMMHYRGFQYQEIAEKLGLPLGTVKSRIFFARKELQSHLKESSELHFA